MWEVIITALVSYPKASSCIGIVGKLEATCHTVFFSYLVSTKIVHPRRLAPVMISTGFSSSLASYSTLQGSSSSYPSPANKY